MRGPSAGGAAEHDCPRASVLEQTARHSAWAWRRFKIFEALRHTYQPYARQNRFAGCGGNLALQVEGNELVLTAFTCGDRLCEVCQATKRRELRFRIEKIVAEHHADCRFFTFTLRHSDTPLVDQIRRLRHSLRLLHRRKAWQATQRGGIDCIECKPAKHGAGWHVHAHCVVEGTWIDQRELSATWHAITGDSSIVDVQRKGTPEEMARYATKYATKPLHEGVYTSRDHLQEAVTALKGQRLVNCWGTWHGLDQDDEPERPTLRQIGTIRELVAASLEGDPGARLWLQMACVKWSALEQAIPFDAVTNVPPPDPANVDLPPPPMDPRWNQVEELPF